MKRLILSIFLLVALGLATTTTETLAANSHTVTTIAHDGGSIYPAYTNQQVPNGYPLEIIGYPQTSYKVTRVVVNNNEVIRKDSVFGAVCWDQEVTEDLIIHVYFGTDKTEYSIDASAGPNGTIAPPGITKYAEGDEPCFTITPDPDYEIEEILVDNIPVNTKVSPYCFDPLDASHKIHVTFKKLPPKYTITITHIFLDEDDNEVPTGDVTSSPTAGVYTYTEGDPVQDINFVKKAGGTPWDIYKIVINDDVVYDDGVPPPEFPTSWTITDYIYQNYVVELTFKFFLGIPYIDIPSLVVSPNPVSGTATITKDADVIFTHIEVVDIMGNTALYIANPSNTINLSSLATGSYIVRFHTEKGFAVRSIIKK